MCAPGSHRKCAGIFTEKPLEGVQKKKAFVTYIEKCVDTNKYLTINNLKVVLLNYGGIIILYVQMPSLTVMQMRQ